MTTDGFTEFYRATYHSLVAQLYAYTGDLAEAQDSAQEAYVRAFLHWSQVSGYGDPRAWVCRVGYRVAVSRWRRTRSAVARWYRHGPPPPEPGPDPGLTDLVAALRQLPEAQRRAIVLYHLGGFPVREIAEIEGVPDGTVKARLARGRQALARLLTTELSGIGGEVS